MGDMTDGLVDALGLEVLINHATMTSYRTRERGTENDEIMKTCLRLFSKDYQYSVINNNTGDLCGHYPPQLVVLEYLTASSTLTPPATNYTSPQSVVRPEEKVESLHDTTQLRDLMSRARLARCRGRFVVPVILFEGKHICRSATISGGAEIYGRQVFDMFISGGGGGSGVGGAADRECSMPSMVNTNDSNTENGVTSSEKVDKENRYSEFSIVSMPYPGCEFFRQWRDLGYVSEGLVFDWTQSFVDAQLDIPNRPSPPRSIAWKKYRSWDLVTLTQNYLKLLLHYLTEGDCGLLVHCISGWDRTPLFISLLRLTLWAERLIHPTLNAAEILYLTIAYDWLLFGHNFPDRLSRGEEVFYFCFNFLQYITEDEEFNIRRRSRQKRLVSRTDSEYQFDGILLEADYHHYGGSSSGGGSYRGSNASISSVSSLNSRCSGVDSPANVSNSSSAPVAFNVGSIEEDAFINGWQMVPSSLADSLRGEGGGIAGLGAGSTPASGPSSGSERAGSRNHSSSSESRYNACHSGSSASGHSCGGVMNSTGSVIMTSRRQRLDEVRHLFTTLYKKRQEGGGGGWGAERASGGSDRGGVEGECGGGGGGVGGIAGLFENFAEKVGIKSTGSAKSTLV